MVRQPVGSFGVLGPVRVFRPPLPANEILEGQERLEKGLTCPTVSVPVPGAHGKTCF